jgi:hypothetical protein
MTMRRSGVLPDPATTDPPQCTNRQIGERLFLAEKTVKNYVSGLLTKLGMQRRTQAAVYGATLRRRPGGGASADS